MKPPYLFCLGMYALSAVALLYLCLTGWVTFGHGLGDVFALLLHVIVYLLVGGLAWLVRQAPGPVYALVVLVMLFHLGLLGLQLTVYRGLEYPWKWNHSLLLRQ